MPLGTAVAKGREAAAEIKMAPGYRVVFPGEAERMEESFGYMAEALLLAMIFVYLILAAQFESFIDPLSIMLSLPLSLVGMAGMLSLTGDTVNIMSLIGLILLMGLVTKNAILLIDYTKVLRRQGMDRRQALIVAGRTRLRPIMMTTLAMIFGMMPLALAIGQGAEMRAPMARAVVGGLITSTLLTLLVVPVVYTLFDDFAAWLHRRRPTPSRAAHAERKRAGSGGRDDRRRRAAAPLLLARRAAVAAAPPPAAPGRAHPRGGGADRHRAEPRRRQGARVPKWVQGKYVEERAAALPRLALEAGATRNLDGSMQAIFGDLIRGSGRADAEDRRPRRSPRRSSPGARWGRRSARRRSAS